MEKQKLDELLNQLHAELQQADSVDEASRAALRTLMADIQKVLGQAAEEQAGGYQSLLDQLQASIVLFEGRHPTLALAITQVINALVDVGV